MAAPAFFNDFNKPVETILDDDYSLAKTVKVKFITSNGITLTSKSEYSDKKLVTGDITVKGKHKGSGFSVDKLQIKPNGSTVGEFALADAAPGLVLTFKGDDKPNGVIGAEYTGPKFAVKAETDILKLEGVKASAVVAQKGAKLGGELDVKFPAKAVELATWKVGAGYGTPKLFTSFTTSKAGSGLIYSVYGLYKCTGQYTVAAKGTCTPGVSSDFLFGTVYKCNPKTTVKGKVNLNAVVSVAVVQDVLDKVQLSATAQIPVKSVSDYKAGLGLTLG